MSVSSIIKKYQDKWDTYSAKKRIVIICAFIVAYIALYVVVVWDSMAIEIVKQGSFNNCPGKTVEQVVNTIFSSANWSSGVDERGRIMVNLEGQATHENGNKADFVMQFIVNEDNGSFNLHAMEVNGIAQPPIMILGLIENMCQR